MKTKEATRYMLQDSLKSCIIFYGVIAFIIIVSLIIKYALGVVDMGTSGMGSATFIFLFVVGLNSFKSQFTLFLQNGISRRTMLVGFVLSSLIVALGMGLIDSLYPLALRGVLGFETTYQMMYSAGTGFGAFAMGLIWNVLAYFTALCFGFLVTTLYYRMNKALKLIVSIGVPVLLFVALPLLEVLVPSINIMSRLMNALTWMLGFDLSTGAVYPARSFGSFCVLSAAFTGLSYLLIRRATVKSE